MKRMPLDVSDKIDDKRHSCSEHILQSLSQSNHALTYKDFGDAFSYGTLRNNVKQLVEENKIVKIPRENPARFILPSWAHRPEYLYVQKNYKKGMAGNVDLLSFLESLPWGSDLGLHNLKCTFEVYHLSWLGEGWKYSSKSQSYSRRLNLSYPVCVQCFDTGTVLVSVKSSCRPFKFDSSGLLALASLLGEVRCTLNAPCIPEPANWLIVQWHMNRDSERIGADGLDFNITFNDFFENMARIYYKHSLEKVRSEVNQTPNRLLKEVFEEILNRDNAPQGDNRF